MSEGSEYVPPTNRKQPKRVLIAMDGSESSEYAFKWYLQNIRTQGDRVIAVHIPEFKCPSGTKVIPTEENRIKLTLAKIAEQLKRAEVDGKVIRGAGNPSHVLIKKAKEQEVDYIVTGSRGLNTLKRTFLGSVSDYLIHNTKVPIVIVRNPEDKLDLK